MGLQGSNLLTVSSGSIEVLENNKHPQRADESSEAYVCLLTSGTTGSPKSAKFSWNRILGAINIHPKFEGNRWLLGYQILGFSGMQVFLQCLLNRGCLVIPKDWSPKAAGEALTQHRVDHLNCTPTFIRQVILSNDQALKSVRTITLGGEVIDQHLIDLIKSKSSDAKIIHVYGSTEIGVSIVVRDEKEGFDAKLIDGQALKIENGELFAKLTDRSMLGYLNNDSFNSTSSNDNRWYRTKDLVEVKGDRVFFLGRLDHVINVGGFKVAPGLVESTIRQVEGVTEVVVTGQKNSVCGYIVKAQILLADGKNPEKMKAEITSHCRTILPYYAVPLLLEFPSTLDYASGYKLKRQT
jgi:acyl-coenzyme A synthetase/AMP-(fatty) acid ligase